MSSKIRDLRRVTLICKFENSTNLNIPSKYVTLIENKNGTLGFYNEHKQKFFQLADITSSLEINYQATDVTCTDWLSMGNAEKVKTITISFEELALEWAFIDIIPIGTAVQMLGTVELEVVRGMETYKTECSITSLTGNTITLKLVREFISQNYKAELCKKGLNGTNYNFERIIANTNHMCNLKAYDTYDAGLIYLDGFNSTPYALMPNGVIYHENTSGGSITKVNELSFGRVLTVPTGTATYTEPKVLYVAGVGFGNRYFHPQGRHRFYQRMTNPYPSLANVSGARSLSIVGAGGVSTPQKVFISDSLSDSSKTWQRFYSGLANTSTTYDYSFRTDANVRYAIATVMSTYTDPDSSGNGTSVPILFTNARPILPVGILNAPTWNDVYYNKLSWDYGATINATPSSLGDMDSVYSYSWQRCKSPQSGGDVWSEVSTNASYKPTDKTYMYRCLVTFKKGNAYYTFLSHDQPWYGVGTQIFSRHYNMVYPLTWTLAGETVPFFTLYCGGTSSTETSTTHKVIYSSIGTQGQESAGLNSVTTSGNSFTWGNTTNMWLSLFPRVDCEATTNLHKIQKPFSDIAHIRATHINWRFFPSLTSTTQEESFINVNSNSFKLVEFNDYKTITNSLLCNFKMFTEKALNFHMENMVGYTQNGFAREISTSGTLSYDYKFGTYTPLDFATTKLIPFGFATQYNNIEYLLFDVL